MSPEPSSTGSRSDRSVLGRIDDAMVPTLQRLARAVSRGLGWPGRLLARFDRWFLGGRPAGAVRAHRGLTAFVVVLLAFTATVVHVQRYPDLRQQQRAAGGDPAGTAEGTVAVVSFTDFRPTGAVAEDLDGLEVQEVQEVLYRLPERDPQPRRLAVEDGMVDAVEQLLAERIAEIETEEADVASTLETTDDADFREDFQARLDELEALRNTLARDPRVVYAVVVEGSVERLRQLAQQEPVRLVDLAPPGTEATTTTFHGVLPTAEDRFEHGRTVTG